MNSEIAAYIEGFSPEVKALYREMHEIVLASAEGVEQKLWALQGR